MTTCRQLIISFSLVGLFVSAQAGAAVTAQDATPGIAASGTPAAGVPGGRATTSQVFWFPGTAWAGTAIPHASSSLVTFDEGASVALETAGLEPGDAVTLWWVIFNDPEACAHGEGGLRCGAGDLLLFGGDAAVGGTLLYGAGHVVGPDGHGYFSSFLATSDTARVFGQGPGLTNPQGADIHFVVRTHGPAQPGLVGAQLESFGGGCNNAPEGAGTAGDFACADLQFAAHEQSLVAPQ
ncbi:MAG: hypothetical protein ACR2GS_11525 [Thermomicrobiales bacterium]